MAFDAEGQIFQVWLKKGCSNAKSKVFVAIIILGKTVYFLGLNADECIMAVCNSLVWCILMPLVVRLDVFALGSKPSKLLAFMDQKKIKYEI